MVRSRELRWGAATAGVVTLTLFAVPAWSPLYADGEHRASTAEHSADHDDDEGGDDDAHDDGGGCVDDATAVRTDGIAAASSSASTASRTQAVMVRTPATAMIRVDAHGGVLAAWTNTGCAPRAGDDLWLLHPDGSITAASPSVVDRQWRGDFSQSGVFVDQRPEGSTHDD